MTWLGKRRRPVSPSRLIVIGASAVVLACMLLYESPTGYSDYTERAHATVVDRVTSPRKHPAPDHVTVFVTYQAEGQEHRRVQLGGIAAGAYDEGDNLTVAYAPGRPSPVITLSSTRRRVHRMQFSAGLALLVVGAGSAARGLTRLRHRSR
ncbi:DUF3592 domain-containing protein [Actinomadura sp. HBU206391]|uniref:DUF3592 domain-containing protein n=1 Tax=Actinomadura sp. HBU206391 TaxID=2731692 RepID=UPI00164F7610|nr:DUF3592 domain-containing protein [Actinomadura sp. HBU206391]MBC6460624.1 hypothetical protein [Actinomadura sp. HBU206391]